MSRFPDLDLRWLPKRSVELMLPSNVKGFGRTNMIGATMWKRFLLVLILSTFGLLDVPHCDAWEDSSTLSESSAPVTLSPEHIKAVNRRRRIIVNYDINSGQPHVFGIDIDKWAKFRFAYADQPGCQIDTMFFCIDGGNLAHYPSKVIPVSPHPQIKSWLDKGIDCIKVAVDEAHKRGLEAFYTYRMNGSDRTPDFEPARLPLKEEHPGWLLEGVWWEPGFWDFTVPEVRAHKLDIIRELTELYDLDGIELDFCRTPPFVPLNEGWQHRGALTDMVRRVRHMLQERGKERGRPYLLSVRVPPTVPGCHHDGVDIETWAQEQLIDLVVIGTHSIEVDLDGFRKAVTGTHVKLYPCMDDSGHSPDGYHRPGLEIERGFFTNWWHQGADGVATFNWGNAPAKMCEELNFPAGPDSHMVSYNEIGDPATLRYKNKVFVVQRKFGGGWSIPWLIYANVCMHAPLPLFTAPGETPAMLTIHIGDDLQADAERVVSTKMMLVLSNVGEEEKVELKLNGILLPSPAIDKNGWRIYDAKPEYFARGPNLVYVRLPDGQDFFTIEKLEMRAEYKSE